jgi:hypothetical protein
MVDFVKITEWLKYYPDLNLSRVQHHIRCTKTRGSHFSSWSYCNREFNMRVILHHKITSNQKLANGAYGSSHNPRKLGPIQH